VARIDEGMEKNRELMAYLEHHGLLPGAVVTVEEVLPFNQTINVRVNREKVVLGMAVARHVYVCEST